MYLQPSEVGNCTQSNFKPKFAVGCTVKIVRNAPSRYIGTEATVLEVIGNVVKLAAYRRKSPLEVTVADLEAA